MITMRVARADGDVLLWGTASADNRAVGHVWPLRVRLAGPPQCSTVGGPGGQPVSSGELAGRCDSYCVVLCAPHRLGMAPAGRHGHFSHAAIAAPIPPAQHQGTAPLSSVYAFELHLHRSNQHFMSRLPGQDVCNLSGILSQCLLLMTRKDGLVFYEQLHCGRRRWHAYCCRYALCTMSSGCSSSP